MIIALLIAAVLAPIAIDMLAARRASRQPRQYVSYAAADRARTHRIR